ncbi:latrophilin Cirl-like isoform X1 [Limulus polyphemus]|uniref:Latrophilin Cirl-like isoform X1 n=2 Tax=Limulus polyphemus TaxID=6850 RepID=A0ABM1S3T8_LIMPO|nr:latrophilin Cirl-like isoform X1 [Limulus polyphemus]
MSTLGHFMSFPCVEKMLKLENKGFLVMKTILLLLLGLVVAVSARRVERPRYRTAYACEGSSLHIVCDNGSLIRLIRANYGRFSISICNDHGALEWSVNCMSPLSFRVMQDSCGMKRSCRIPASTTVFGDPCPRTTKYLEAHYQCVPETTTTQRPPPPITVTRPFSSGIKNITSSTTISTTSVASATTTTTTSTTTTTQAPYFWGNPIVLNSSIIVQEVTKGPSTTSPSQRSPEIKIPLELLVGYCPPITSHELLWNWTKAGITAVQACPGGAVGSARWECDLETVTWKTSFPDLSDCNSVWISNLGKRIQKGDSVVNLAGELAMMTKVKKLYGGDMIQATDIVNRLVYKLEDIVEQVSDAAQREKVVVELMQFVVDVGNNLLDQMQEESWQELPHDKQKLVASDLLLGLQENAHLLADMQKGGDLFRRTQKNLLASVQVIEVHKVKDISFPRPEDIMDTPWKRMQDVLYLPVQAQLENSKSGLVKVIFMTYNRLDNILDPTPPDVTPSMWRGERGWKTNALQIINSKIMAVSLGKSRSVLSKPVIITLVHTQTENVTNPQCVFWDFTYREWLTDGCSVRSTNLTHTVCACNHLTNFAVLMDIKGVKLSVEHNMALRVITYIGCVVSVVCLLLTILTFQLFRSLNGDRTTIHKNLCICLLIAEAVFLIGIDQTHTKAFCGIVAGLLHYFFLAAFVWMFFEGFQLYVMLIEVFESEKSRVKFYYAAAYGIPALIVMISAIIDPFSYGTKDYCWLKVDNYFVFSFVGPVAAILLANMVFLTIAICIMCRHSNLTATMKAKEQTKLTSVSDEDECSHRQVLIMVWIRGALVLVFLLGLTWAFGLLYLSKESVVMAYIFTILNSLQGLFIFLFHCVKNDKVQKEYKKILHRTQWLPDCIRKSKHTERRSSFYVHSNGTMSAPNSSGQQTSPSQGWNGDPTHQSSTNSSSLRFSSQGLSSTVLGTKSGHERKSSRSSNTSTRSLSKKSKPVKETTFPIHNNNGIVGDLSVVDCSVIDSECVTDYCSNKLTAYNTATEPIRLGPYGHLSETDDKLNLFPDHIYEAIDEEQIMEYGSTNWQPQPPPYSTVPLDGHIRNNSDCSHQSSSSLACDQHPLISRAFPERNALVSLAQVLNSAPRNASLPMRHVPCLQNTQSQAASGKSSNTVTGMKNENTQPVEPTQSDEPDGEHLDVHLHSLPNLHQGTGELLQQLNKYPSDNAVVMAVLDGERVVCKLQPETYRSSCNTSKSPYCHKVSELSTDC